MWEDHWSCVERVKQKLIVVLCEVENEGFLKFNFLKCNSDGGRNNRFLLNILEKLHKRLTSFLRDSAELNWN